jgi:ESS family glutamate:Na+ symporter
MNILATSLPDGYEFGVGNLTSGVITVAAICVLMLFANILRRRIAFLRRSLMPTAVIAGIIGLIDKEIVQAIFDYNIFSVETLNGLVFHLLSVGFIALCLRDKDDYQYSSSDGEVKIKRVNAVKSGSMIVSTYLVQGIIGIIVTAVLAYTVMSDLNPAVGIVLPLGFGQGPNQASNTGAMWDQSGVFAAFGDGSGQNFGITVAAIGFLWAAIAGVIMTNRIAKRKGITLHRDEFAKAGNVNSHSVEEADEVPLSESIDKFTLQICMVGGAYLITIGILVLLEFLFQLSGVGFLINLIPTIWGFGFMIAVLVALLIKIILKKLFKKGIMHRKYPNSYMMNRISGAAFDISIVSALCLISVASLGMLWIPILIFTSIGGIVTLFFLRFLCNRVYVGYEDEAFLGMFGMLTGTISNGMILIREIDPEFKTPIADDLVSGSSTGIVLGFPLLLLVSIATTGFNWVWVLGIIAVYMLALIGFMLNWHTKLFRRKKVAAEEVAAEGDKDSEVPTETAE